MIGETASENPHEGLKWVLRNWYLVPQWTIEPDLEAIKRAVEMVFSLQEVNVSFLAQGAFNKIYNICCGEREHIMRVSLPVDPKWKTLSEVATLKWVWDQELLPVSEILAYETSRDNPVGFEWILMSKLPAVPLADVWRSMSFEAKKKIVQKFARFSSVMFKKQLHGIGNIYPVSQPETSISSVINSGAHDKDKDLPKVKRIVSVQFFWGDHILQNISRGPFCSSKDWLDARLSFNEHDCLSTLTKYEGKDLDIHGEDDVADATRTLAIVHRLKDLLKSSFGEKDIDDTLKHLGFRSCFLSSEQEAEPSMLVHSDLSRHNILVDKAGALTGVVDWECVSALPLWKACDYPSFLRGRPRYEKPDKEAYFHHGEEGSLYWELMLEYELTILRQHFLDEMRILEPSWIKVFESSQRQRDFDSAVTHCDNEFCARSINEWIDDINSGKENLRSLHDRLYQC